MRGWRRSCSTGRRSTRRSNRSSKRPGAGTRSIHGATVADTQHDNMGGNREAIGVLASGGLDSSILIGDLLRQGRRVQPFYVRTGLLWQAEELPALERYLAAVAAKGLAGLVVLDLPLADLYDGHWSLTGRETPGADTPDVAVFLPGRNALLM